MTAPKEERKIRAALVGNPNVGKSTLFNSMTGLKQHTGNWPGKTVELITGTVKKGDTRIELTDLPGTYSLQGNSQDEQVTGDYLVSGEADCVVVVCDGNTLERSLILALEIMALSDKVIICINLMDEAQRRGIQIQGELLSQRLNVPVVLTSAGKGHGLETLKSAIEKTAFGPPQLRGEITDVRQKAKELTALCCQENVEKSAQTERRIDALFASRRFGIGFMVLVLLGIVWLTVWGANTISQGLEWVFEIVYGTLIGYTHMLPAWCQGILIDGVFATVGRVICVMLPPMMIFFPLFTLLENIGYLPRMALLLDPCMARCGGCGRQALTLCMGLGCNAVGVMGCRIIPSPKQRMAAMLTNAFMPCNGRFPSLILLGSLLFPKAGTALVVAACVVMGAVGAMAVSGLLNKTVLRSDENTFAMEIPPFRRPQIGQILVRSLLDRTLQIAGRAIVVAAPAGALLWLVSTTGAMQQLCSLLDPLGVLLGMNGIILTAFLFCLPANELLIPVILMILSGSGSLQAVSGMGLAPLKELMTLQVAVCTMVFTLFHWPCATTLMTFYRETRSIKNTAVACFLPTAVGMVCCLALNLLLKLLPL